MITKKEILKAYTRIREIDHTIPDEVLDYMKHASIEYASLKSEVEKQREVIEAITRQFKGCNEDELKLLGEAMGLLYGGQAETNKLK